MVFDIAEIGDEGLDIMFQVAKDQFEIDQEDCSLSKDVDVSGHLARVGDDIYLKGKVTTELVLSCSRCLDPLTHSIDSKLKSHFVPPDPDSDATGEVELHASDIDTEVYEGDQIDLTQSVLDGILLTVPVISLCSDNCKGMCPQCGVKLSRGSCDCSNEASIDPRLEVLKQLKNKLK